MPYRREWSWHIHIKNPFIKALLIAWKINHLSSSRHFFSLWNIILLTEYYFLLKSVLSCISWTYKLAICEHIFSHKTLAIPMISMKGPESIYWYVGYSLQFSQISKSSQSSMMSLCTMAKILLLNEHIAHSKSCGIWKHKFRVVSNYATIHVQCESFWIGQI